MQSVSSRSYHMVCINFCIMVDAVLGNHDYRGDAEAQLSPVLRGMDSRWLCLRSFIVDSGIVLLLSGLSSRD